MSIERISVVRSGGSATTYAIPSRIEARNEGWGSAPAGTVAASGVTSVDGSVDGRSNTALAAVTAPLPEISRTIAAATKNESESITNAGPIPTTTMNAPASGGPTIDDSWSVPWS